MNKKLIIGAVIFSLIIPIVFFGIRHNVAQAQEGAVSSAIAVPISTGLDLQSIMNYRKNFGLDLIATNIAKRILHTMSLDIVDWINSGFNGNPAFLSNPEGFFLDAADQVTGDFIFKNGLTGLCSPFEIDIKAALYMGQAGYDTRYTCTLGQIINNTQNIGDNIYVNGSSIDGFMGGDFTQGGWPAFIALTTEPQNNPTGAYLKARSELAYRIGERRAAINLDLNRGGGFLSWEECTNVPDNSYVPYLDNEDPNLYEGTYKKVCETKTPGSVISGSVNKTLGAGQDELVAADDINSIINALISTLARTVLTGGLKSFGAGGGSGNGNYSYTQYRQMVDSDYQTNNQSAAASSQTDISTQVSNITSIKSYYDRSVEAVNTSKTKYLEARACYANNLSGTRSMVTMANKQIANIDTRITTEVDPLLSTLLQKQSTANSLYQKAQNVSSQTTSNDINVIRQQTEESIALYTSLSGINQSTVDTAISDWQNAINKSNAFTSEAENMLRNCQN